MGAPAPCCHDMRVELLNNDSAFCHYASLQSIPVMVSPLVLSDLAE